MAHKCLYCCQPLAEGDLHEQCSLTFFGTKEAPVLPYTLADMEMLAREEIRKSIAAPGIQPKLSLSITQVDAPQNTAGRLTVIGALEGNYILKPPMAAYSDMPANEHISMRMAAEFGINTVPCSLIRLASGELAYITRRIDRGANGQKIHMLDMCQITESAEKYRGTMEQIGKALGAYSANPMLDKVFLFEIVLFCFLSGNNDMHLKNFSMIASPAGWVMAPAYDLLNVAILIPEDKEELALHLDGKKSRLNYDNFSRFGKSLGMNAKQINGVMSRFINKKAQAIQWLEVSFLSAEMKENYISLLHERYHRLGLDKQA